MMTCAAISPDIDETVASGKRTRPASATGMARCGMVEFGEREDAAIFPSACVAQPYTVLDSAVFVSHAAIEDFPSPLLLAEAFIIPLRWTVPAAGLSSGDPPPHTAEEFERFRRALLGTFESEPVEDGYSHRGEALLQEAIEQNSAKGERWIWQFLREEGPSAVAAMLRCLGRLKSPGSEPWRTALIDAALADPASEVRDAAIQATEFWGDPRAIDRLRRHDEWEPWLRDYVARVIRDLSE